MTTSSGPPALPAIQPALLRDQVYLALRNAIFRGDLPPGARLVERTVAEQMGVSLAPVREALRKLEEEGLVETHSHRATFVTAVSVDEIRHIFGLRRYVEVEAAVLAVPRLSDADLEALRRRVDEMQVAGDQDDVFGFVEADVAFHRTILNAAAQPMLLRVWNLIDAQVRRVLQITHPSYNGSLQVAARVHLPLLNALTDRDVEQTRALMFEHMSPKWLDDLKNG